ncbi:MAG: 1-deoxy-D-xylulose-5-phosphate reductoisomerase, partial [Spirulinaceae cyanobacterium RM2_2_10]|nr:1-deoxy-D-xylulose-5-phosphate reductoisomerase [Spirulinaceae cyanobacterium RM2_2_10]
MIRRDRLGRDGILSLGSQPALVRQLILNDAMRLAFGFLFLFCGLFPLIVALSKKADKTYVSFGVVALLIGIYTITPTQMVRLIFNYGLSWTYLHHTAFHALPASIGIFFEQLFGPGPRKVVRRLWQLQLLYVPIALLIGSFVEWRMALYPTHLNILLLALTLIVLAAVNARTGNREAKIFTWGLAIFLLTVLYDLFVYLFSFSLFNAQLFYWGMLVFVLCLAFILDYRFTEAQKHLKAYSAASDRFVPHEFLNFLGKESIIHVQLGDQVQQEMTVLFSDIRSFTTLSERMTPAENFNFLNAYLHRVGPIIRKHNGFIDKYIGDAVMALFPNSADDAVMAAIVGAAGLSSSIAAARAGKKVLLANKEALVMAGPLFMAAVRANGAELLPVDSEHNAIFQCLPPDFATSGLDACGVRRILLTGSGGPFRLTPLEQLPQVTQEQACAHPNWRMGRKISVDSATMMNKGLEVIEAHWLFGAPSTQIDVVVHPQSVIHSMVEYEDGSVLAQLGHPDMRTPIAHALAWPRRLASGASFLDFARMGTLEFQAPDLARFPCLRLAFAALETGGTAPAILNAANEVAV